MEKVMDIKLILSRNDLLPNMGALRSQKILGVDCETTGLDPHRDRLRLVQIACPGSRVFVIDCFAFLPEGLGLLRSFFSARNVKVFHNSKFDLKFLKSEGISPPPLLFDTMLAARILLTSGGPERVSLKEAVAHYLGVALDKKEQGSDWSGELSESQIEYAAKDAEILIPLREKMVKEIYANSLERVAEIEFHCVKAVAEMEYYGVNLDTERWKRLTRDKEAERDNALSELYKFSGKPPSQTTLWGGVEEPEHNFDNNSFTLSLLQKEGIDVKGTSRSELSDYADHPLVSALLDYRRASKSLSAFLYPFPKMINQATGRIHPHYGQISAASGRMSCYRPNVQQIPRETAFRECFSAPHGKKLLVADYSQIELRVAAEVSGDGRMTDAYMKGRDLHTLTASLLCGKAPREVSREERQAAKAVNFGLIYGMGAAGLRIYAHQSYGVLMTKDEASEFRAKFFAAYPGIERWHDNIKASKPSEGRSLCGRRFLYRENQALSGYYNMPVQGSAADIAKLALGMLFAAKKGEVHIIAAVHDEILMECGEDYAEENAALLRDTMEEAGRIVMKNIPCKAEVTIGDTWASK
jgi:DNA polymerase-1